MHRVNTGDVSEMSKTKFWGQITGYSLILMAVAAGFSVGYVNNIVYFPTDSHATYTALNEYRTLFGFGLTSWCLVIALDAVVSIGVFQVYSKANGQLAIATAILRLIYTVILAVAVAQLAIPIMKSDLVNGHSYFAVFDRIWSYGLLVFGVHLLALAIICWRSGFTPIPVSMLVAIAGLCYAIIEISKMSLVALGPIIESTMAIPMVLGELTFAVWIITWSRRLHVDSST